MEERRITAEDIELIRSTLTPMYEQMFVSKDACAEKNEQTNEKINSIAIRQTEHGTKLSTIERLLWLVESSVIIEVVGAILALVILKK